MIGTRIRQARKEAGLSQTSLADLVGVRQSAVSEWEAGRSDPTTDSLSATAIALGVAFEWLATGRGEMRVGGLTAREPGLGYEVLPPDQQQLLTLYRKLNAARRGALLRFMEEWI
ncbi:helix-turn-helix domain-containing protein [Chitinimonas taiwanensis]|uniref:helix-turn-helix domain-containing protein n=1 Tax=Chitinimonas taiwanensis TaxID=240412 RepID=UPI0035B0EF34